MSRQAKVSNSGCGIFLSRADLKALGINPENADTVNYRIFEDRIVVQEVENES